MDKLKYESGENIDQADAERGYLTVPRDDDPSRDRENYKPWLTQPKRDDDESQSPAWLSQEYQEKVDFQDRNRESKGLLTRNTYER